MNSMAQRIAIAEACGWVHLNPSPNYWDWHHPVIGWALISELPDYINDLNAMHEAEKVLTDHQRRTFNHNLESVVCGNCERDSEDRFWVIHATAAQRAEAFLRTINKWTE